MSLSIFSFSIYDLVGQPLRAGLISLFFLLAHLMLWRKTGTLFSLSGVLLLLSSITWFCYCGWETHCQTQGYDIRIDLILIMPFVIAISVLSIVTTLIKILIDC